MGFIPVAIVGYNHAELFRQLAQKPDEMHNYFAERSRNKFGMTFGA